MATCFALLLSFFVLPSCWVSCSSAWQNPQDIGPMFSSWLSEWLRRYNEGLEMRRRGSASALWQNLLFPGDQTSKSLQHQQELMAQYQRDHVDRLERVWRYIEENGGVFPEKTLPEDERRMLHLITRGPRYTAQMARSLSSTVSAMRKVYSSASASDREINHQMSVVRDPEALKKIWESWHLQVGPPIRPLFTEVVRIMNEAAMNGGYQDMGSAWREELELGEDIDVKDTVDRLYHEVAPLYALLHAHARYALLSNYGASLVHTEEPIPAHLLGDLWGQNWEALLDLIMPPNEEQDKVKLEPTVTVKTIVKNAEDFFQGLGFPKLPEKVWNFSVFGTSEAPHNATCQTRALDMFSHGDYRLLFCEESDAKSLEVAYHELGHIHYFHAYSNQSSIFRDGSNSAAHETIGDAVQLGAATPKIRKEDPTNHELRFLLKMALRKLPLLAFARVVDEWRWDVFEGKVPETDYNKAWWVLKTRYQGVKAPSPRSEEQFDPAAKFHIPDNTPYIRYFIAVVAQFQIHKNLCNVSNAVAPLHNCSIGSSRKAGQLLWSMMSMGSSIPWPQFLKGLAGSSKLNSRPLLEYFAPLQKWLAQEVQRRNMTVGWMVMNP